MSQPARDRSTQTHTLWIEIWVFAILLITYAFYWHNRDWNTSSRLMLTYAFVDRGTIVLNGLDDHSRDLAVVAGRYYSDKTPGYSLLAAVPYAIARVAGIPAHPLDRSGPSMPYWAADYWATLGTSGLFTALSGSLLSWIAGRVGCGPRGSAIVGLSYGLATPASVYATLAYGHQPAAFALLASFALLWNGGPRVEDWRSDFGSGFLAACASVIELQVGPLSALLGFYLLIQVIMRTKHPRAILWFGLGVLPPTLLLLGYDVWAFGDPFDMGYFHLKTPRFARIHSSGHPLGLVAPEWRIVWELLMGWKRGLFIYAPITILACPGWLALLSRGKSSIGLFSALACLVQIVVIASYPEWSGGWTTGPRLLLPMLPFALIGVAGLIAAGGKPALFCAVTASLIGGIIIFMFQGIGGRVPDQIGEPILKAVLPLWNGHAIPGWAPKTRFDRNLVSCFFPEWVQSLPKPMMWLQFVPLIVFQILSIAVVLIWPWNRIPRK